MKCVLGIDQSTQGTKVALLNESGRIIAKSSLPHKQIIDVNGYVSHDPEEIYKNLIDLVKEVVIKTGENEIVSVGISNQRETTLAWNEGGTPINYAVVWQCSRAEKIVNDLAKYAETVKTKTGLPLSPYFPAAKMNWLLNNSQKPCSGKVYCGTMDAWLIYKLTKGKSFYTDASNASRTQLYSIEEGRWDDELCGIFGIHKTCLPAVCDSNALFGYTNFEGALPQAVPIYAVMGDSHAALFAQNCRTKGSVKVTYGTGSSVMMNIGDKIKKSKHGLATSLAWRIDGKTDYVFEGNINYTGAVISWLKNDLSLINSESEIEGLIGCASPDDETVIIPAFSGLSAPYWNAKVKAMIYGMSRTTKRAEIVKAAVESIAFQVEDVLAAMAADSENRIERVRADGGASANKYLMQFQSDIGCLDVDVSDNCDLSLTGAAYLAGLSAGLYTEDIFKNMQYTNYTPSISYERSREIKSKWKNAVAVLLG